MMEFSFVSSYKNRGQSLIEVTFATAVVSIVLVVILSSVIQSVSNSRVALEQTQATSYAQETMEWIRSQRDIVGWGVFSSALTARGGDVIYCLMTIPDSYASLLLEVPSECDDEDTIGDSSFRRELRLQSVSSSEISVQTVVVRPGKSGEIITRLESILADRE